MKTKIQKERDKKNGILNFEHSFDKKTGKILGRGLIRQEISPEAIMNTIEPLKQKLNELKDRIILMEKQIDKTPIVCTEKLKEFLELQKLAGDWMRAESARVQLKQIQEEYDLLTDDLLEQEMLVADYKNWKKKKG